MFFTALKNTFFTNPMVTKEVILKFRYKRFFWVVSLYALFTFLSIATFLYIAGGFTYRTSDLITWLSEVSRASFTFLTFWQFAFVALITLSFTSSSVTSEKEQKTLSLLLCSQLDEKMIIVGKFITATLYNLLMILILLPIFSTIFILGGISLNEILASTLLIFIGAAFFSSIAIFWSTTLKKSVMASSMSLITGIGFVMGPLILPAVVLEILKYKGISIAGFRDIMYFLPQHFNPAFPIVLLFEKSSVIGGTVFSKYGHITLILSSVMTLITSTLAFLLLSILMLRRKFLKH